MNKREELVLVRIAGLRQAIYDLCDHWLFGHTLVERGDEGASFRMPEQAMRTYVPYFLLPYGKSIRVLEPAELKDAMGGIAAGLADYYRSF
jgi:predicted DNA-binding transcriptional regulator YafY